MKHYTKYGLLDRRFRNSKTLEAREQEFWQKYGALIGTTILGFIAGGILATTLWNAFHPEIISPKGLGIARVPRVIAAEVTPTPAKTVKPKRNYTYYLHSKKPHYQEIVNHLRTIYINWEDAAELVARESGFNPHVVNSIGACGLPQSLPCKKMGCSLNDVKCQLDWQKEYVSGRYGTISNALNHSYKFNWY